MSTSEGFEGLRDYGAGPVGSGTHEAMERVQKLDEFGRAYATGKRKNAIARVWLKPGKGKIDWEANRFLVGNRATLDAFKRPDADARLLADELDAQNEKYLARRARYLLYN